MSVSEAESVNSSNATDEEEVMMFECRKCGQQCTPAEKDSHRAMHSRLKRKRGPSPDQSEAATLFQQVPPSPSRNAPASSKRPSRAAKAAATPEIAQSKAEKREESGKRRSIKKYDKNVKPIKCKGV